MMKTVTVSSKEQALEALKDQNELGQRFAAASSTGLPPGRLRITFLPDTAFQRPQTDDDHAAARSYVERYFDSMKPGEAANG